MQLEIDNEQSDNDRIEAYELLVKNEQYCQRTWFKLKRKIRNKIENI